MLGIEIAKKYVGLNEKTDTQQLISLFKSQAIHNDIVVDPSKVSWCSCMMNFCERESGHKGTGSQAALSWKNYGEEVTDWDKAQEGDICVFERGDPSLGKGHVTYFMKWEDERDGVLVLGGNQSDKVCYEVHSQEGLIAIRRSV